MRTRKQHDARTAYKHVQQVTEELKKDYARAVYRFPILVRINGLQQTIGFYEGKQKAGESGRGEGTFLKHIQEALNLGLNDNEDFSQDLYGMELEQYLWCSRRCLEMSTWYRRFVESILKVDLTGHADDETETSSGE